MEKETYSRRSFLNKLWAGLGLIAFGEIIATNFAFFRPGNKPSPATDEEAIVVAGAVDNFEPGSVSAFVQGKFYLARLDDGGFLAMSRTCTHLGCSIPWVEKENRFICPCHSSAFEITGEVANPPASRALDIYPVTIENHIVRVDTSQAGKRSVFAADQVTYPETV